MKIIITIPDSVFGTIVKEFDNQADALRFMQVCIDNEADFTVGME